RVPRVGGGGGGAWEEGPERGDVPLLGRGLAGVEAFLTRLGRPEVAPQDRRGADPGAGGGGGEGAGVYVGAADGGGSNKVLGDVADRLIVTFERDCGRYLFALVRPLRLDDDHAVRAAHPVYRRAGAIFEHFDGRDVVRVKPAQSAVRTRLDWEAVDHVEGLA